MWPLVRCSHSPPSQEQHASGCTCMVVPRLPLPHPSCHPTSPVRPAKLFQEPPPNTAFLLPTDATFESLLGANNVTAAANSVLDLLVMDPDERPAAEVDALLLNHIVNGSYPTVSGLLAVAASFRAVESCSSLPPSLTRVMHWLACRAQLVPLHASLPLARS